MGVKVLTISEDILGANKEIAKRNQSCFDKHGILCINVMSSPGAGKTSLIRQTISRLAGKARIAVIEGDVASSIDAEEIHKYGVAVVQINTAGGCHLDANMVSKALDDLSLDKIDLLLIENVGNLICPAEFALGEHRRVVLFSLPEGDDKPYKYPLMFMQADVLLLNKVDLLPYLEFNMKAFHKAVTGLNSDVAIFQVSCKTGQGLEDWFSWLQEQLKEAKSRHNA